MTDIDTERLRRRAELRFARGTQTRSWHGSRRRMEQPRELLRTADRPLMP